jgi:hypothetical protein
MLFELVGITAEGATAQVHLDARGREGKSSEAIRVPSINSCSGLRQGVSRMRGSLFISSLIVFGSSCVASCGLVPVAHAATDTPAGMDRPIDKLTITRPTWHRGAGLLYGEATVHNRNPYSVKQVIIMCDLFDQWGNPIGTKSTALIRPFPPGETRVSGIEFPTTVPNMEGGACRPVSAESSAPADTAKGTQDGE